MTRMSSGQSSTVSFEVLVYDSGLPSRGTLVNFTAEVSFYWVFFADFSIYLYILRYFLSSAHISLPPWRTISSFKRLTCAAMKVCTWRFFHLSNITNECNLGRFDVPPARNWQEASLCFLWHRQANRKLFEIQDYFSQNVFGDVRVLMTLEYFGVR